MLKAVIIGGFAALFVVGAFVFLGPRRSMSLLTDFRGVLGQFSTLITGLIILLGGGMAALAVARRNNALYMGIAVLLASMAMVGAAYIGFDRSMALLMDFGGLFWQSSTLVLGLGVGAMAISKLHGYDVLLVISVSFAYEVNNLGAQGTVSLITHSAASFGPFSNLARGLGVSLALALTFRGVLSCIFIGNWLLFDQEWDPIWRARVCGVVTMVMAGVLAFVFAEFWWLLLKNVVNIGHDGEGATVLDTGLEVPTAPSKDFTGTLWHYATLIIGHGAGIILSLALRAAVVRFLTEDDRRVELQHVIFSVFGIAALRVLGAITFLGLGETLALITNLGGGLFGQYATVILSHGVGSATLTVASKNNVLPSRMAALVLAGALYLGPLGLGFGTAVLSWLGFYGIGYFGIGGADLVDFQRNRKTMLVFLGIGMAAVAMLGGVYLGHERVTALIDHTLTKPLTVSILELVTDVVFYPPTWMCVVMAVPLIFR